MTNRIDSIDSVIGRSQLHLERTVLGSMMDDILHPVWDRVFDQIDGPLKEHLVWPTKWALERQTYSQR